MLVMKKKMIYTINIYIYIYYIIYIYSSILYIYIEEDRYKLRVKKRKGNKGIRSQVALSLARVGCLTKREYLYLG